MLDPGSQGHAAHRLFKSNTFCTRRISTSIVILPLRQTRTGIASRLQPRHRQPRVWCSLFTLSRSPKSDDKKHPVLLVTPFRCVGRSTVARPTLTASAKSPETHRVGILLTASAKSPDTHRVGILLKETNYVSVRTHTLCKFPRVGGQVDPR